MSRLNLKPTHKPVRACYSLSASNGEKAGERCRSGPPARQHHWTLVPEWEIRRAPHHPLRVHGARYCLSASTSLLPIRSGEGKSRRRGWGKGAHPHSAQPGRLPVQLGLPERQESGNHKPRSRQLRRQETGHALFDRELQKVIRALRTDEGTRERPPSPRL